MAEGMNKDDFESFESLMKRMEEFLSKKDNKKMDTNNNNTDMVWFSMNPDMDFISHAPTDINADINESDSESLVARPNAEKQKGRKSIRISPDLQHFMLEAGLLFYDALYAPFNTGKGRLTDFFSWVEKARDRMEQEDFTNNDRLAFSEWCYEVGNTLLKAQSKHGLWLTDDEEDLVATMTSGIFGDILPEENHNDEGDEI
jgi:hypothetical protein